MFYSDYFTRPQDCDGFNETLYHSKINSQIKGNRTDHLFSDCFSNHVDFTDTNVQSLVYCPNAENRCITRDNLSAYFINTHYDTPKILDFLNDERELDFKDFLHKFVDSPNFEIKKDRYSIGSNRVRFVVGDVGEGKSSFIKKVMVTIARKKKEYDNNFQLLLLYMDIENRYNYKKEKPAPLNPVFLADLFNHILDEIKEQAPDVDMSSFNAINPSNNPEYSLKSVLKFLHSKKIRPLLFVDNLDCYHFYYARYSYFEQYEQDQLRSIEDNVMWLLHMLTSKSKLGHMGMNVMIAARRYVYEKILAKQSGLDTDADTTEAIKLSTPPEQIIVNTRLALLSDAIKVVEKYSPGVVKGMKEQLVPSWYDVLVKNFTVKKNTPVRVIYKLGQHGHRSLVKFLSSLNIPYKNTELMDRFLNRQVSTLYILYFNDMMKKYTQKHNHFPNMFLNDCTLINAKDFPDAHKPHMHSYWIKYFMLKFLVKRGRLKFSDLYNIFHIKGEYEDYLVQHVAGSLCTANEFRCAELEEGQADVPLNARKLKPTERGRMLCGEMVHENELCFGFEYLSTIIDDMWLAFPKSYVDSIYDPELNYSSLYETNGKKYSEYSAGLTIKKSYNILPFIRCLAACYEAEIQDRKRDLHAFLKENSLIPDFDKISDGVIESAKYILISLGRKDHTSSINKLSEYRDALLSDHKKIKKIFENYYDSGIKVSP